MTYRFGKITFQDQLQKLEKAGYWLNSIGIKTEKTRFDEVLQLNKEIVERKKNKLTKNLIKKHGNLKIYFALTEASSFIQIYEAFKDQKNHLPRAKLQKILEGPYYSWDEKVKKNNIEPRNILFELEAASRFKKCGFPIIGFDDVDFMFGQRQFNIQCKRLHSKSKERIGNNVSKATTQFYKKMKSAPNLKGIICLSIDKLTGKENMFLKVKSPDEIRLKMNTIENSFLDKYRVLWQSLVNINILAVLIFVHIVVIIEEQPHDLLTSCCDIAFDVIPIRGIQTVDYNLIKEIGKRLED